MRKDYAKLADAEYRQAVKHFKISATGLSFRLDQALTEFQCGRLSRAKFCEIVLRWLWCYQHGVKYTEESWWKSPRGEKGGR